MDMNIRICCDYVFDNNGFGPGQFDPIPENIDKVDTDADI
jgi:hypothetical protein